MAKTAQISNKFVKLLHRFLNKMYDLEKKSKWMLLLVVIGICVFSLAFKRTNETDRELKNLEYVSKQEKPLQTSLHHCDKDCQKLQNLFNNEWPKTKIKAVIYYLLRTKDIRKLQRAIELMDTNFNKKYGYPYIIFHEDDFTPHRSKVRHFTNNPEHIYFQTVDFSRLPDHITLDDYRKARYGFFCSKFGIG